MLFIDDDHTKEIQIEKLFAYFTSLIANKVTNQIIVDCLIMVMSPTYCVSLGIQNIAKEIFCKFIITYDIFWTTMVNVDIENMGINLRNYFHSLLPPEKIARLVPTQESTIKTGRRTKPTILK